MHSNVHKRYNSESLGVSGLMKSYQGRNKSSGDFNEDIQSAFQLYETLSDMCHLSEEEKSKGIAIMLCDDALTYYSTLPNKSGIYKELKEKILSYYKSEEQKGRILTTWQS